MKTANNIKVSVFCKEGSDEDKISSSLVSLFPFDLVKEKIRVKRSVATGFEEKKIVILEVFIEKERHTNAFLVSLKSNLTDDQKKLLLRQLESRLDDQLFFYLRLDLNKLCVGSCWITDGGNCFHIKINVAAFPKKREIALNILKDFISN